MMFSPEDALKLVTALQAEAARLEEEALSADEPEATRLLDMAERFRRKASEARGERPPTTEL